MKTNNFEVDKMETEFHGTGKSNAFEHVKNIIAERLHSAAEGLGGNGAGLDGESAIATYGKQASEWLEHSAEYVREFDCTQADSTIREYVNQSPGRSLFIAGAVGLIIGSILRRR
ncbi:MAG: DUF883 C-terminal domain-containing protein [Desulfomicrobium sp.]|nr:DUF883 C-terminal domain-containing protein [Desulfomicrobium sp.]